MNKIRVMMPEMKMSEKQFLELKRFLTSDSQLLVGVRPSNDGLEKPPERLSPRYKMLALANSTERVIATPLNYIPALLFLFKEMKMYSSVFSSDQTREDLGLRSSVYSLIELDDSIKELKRGQKTLERVTKQYKTVDEVTRQDVADIKMVHFALGTVFSILGSIAKEKDHELNFSLAEVVSASLPGLSKFRSSINLDQVRVR